MMIVPTCLVLAATGPAARDRALTPPMGWRHWNQWNGNINQGIIEGIIYAIAKRRDTGLSLSQAGYKDVGIDDGWQKCGNYGPAGYRYHTAGGDPVIDTEKFPNLTRVTELAHAHNLTAGWYGNACGCVDGCCSDHCDTLECFAGDVDATVAMGFDSFKIDGCGAQRDIELWARSFNHSIVAAKKPLGMLIENCHDGDGDSPGANEPHYDERGNLWCPFHTYRTSGDARPTYGSLLNNLNSTRRLAIANLSVPGCWAFADMMEIGVTATQHMHDCGESGTEVCVPLNATEARSHFGAWAIVSSPLILSFDLRDEVQLRRHWATITNRHAIEVNQDYAGFSGTLFAESSVLVNFTACDWKSGVSCAWPSWTSWYKPLSGRDARGSTMAVLLMNNAPSQARLRFDWAAVPGLGSSVNACTVFDVWQQRSLGRFSGPTYTTAHAVMPRDSHFVTLSACGDRGAII
jgi:alpha-galactosidase